MNDIRKQKNIEELRKRLYARDVVHKKTERHVLSDDTPPTPTEWKKPESDEKEVPEKGVGKVRSLYRSIMLIGSLLVFIVGVSFAAWFLFSGDNQISSDNIQLTVTGPSAIGGGEDLAYQVTVSNQNPVPIESAVLIINYPSGARSVTEGARELFEERIPINSVSSGEAQNIPLEVTIFGEEGEEKQISATIEYRIQGSNGTFFKESDPFAFRLISTPLVLRVENTEKVVAGQMVEMKVSLQSNATNPLSDILVQAEYPNGFRFEESFPPTEFGDNVWLIDELAPEESTEITVRGVVSGLTEETFRINFNAGPTDPNNQYRISSQLADAWADFSIERPFVDVAVAINGMVEEEVIVQAGVDSQVTVDIVNTLDETVYDMVVEVMPGGNAFREDSVVATNGFYDSNSGTVRWEVANNPDLAEVFPGGKRSLTFKVDPDEIATASFDVVVNVYARRIGEASAQEQLIGTGRGVAKYSSTVFVGGQAGYNNGLFSDSGPIPPVVGETTTYTLTLVAEAGVNDISDVLVTTSLPTYITWLDNYQGTGEVIYNTVSKQLEWRPGNISANERRELSFQVGLTPSVSQVESIPTLINSQQLRASDRFTGAVLRATFPAITTSLSTEAGFAKGNGEVLPSN